MSKQTVDSSVSSSKRSLPHFLTQRLCEGGFILVLSLALFVLLSLVTYHAQDPSWMHVASKHAQVANAGGQVGAYLADGLYAIFGYVSYLVPVCFAYLSCVILSDVWLRHGMTLHVIWFRALGLVFLWISSCGLLSLRFAFASAGQLHRAGGWLGHTVFEALRPALNIQGSFLVLCALFLVGLTGLTGFSWILATEKLGVCVLFLVQMCTQAVLVGWHWLPVAGRRLLGITRILAVACKSVVKYCQGLMSRSAASAQQVSFVYTQTPSVLPPKIKRETPRLLPVKTLLPVQTAAIEVFNLATAEPEPESPLFVETFKAQTRNFGGLPSLNLLEKSPPIQPMGGYQQQELELLSREVEQHLMDFGIQADVVSVHPGPVITRFELQLAAGIKVSRLTALSKDLARSLSVSSVRVVEIIPGKTVVGLELPNPTRAMVCLSEVLSSDVYQNAYSALTLALGVDIAGHPMVVDLAKMPHLLVAGTTGSGKSVGINAMILSLLFKATPKQVRLILIDPKMLELSVYDGIPHLLTPVVTDMKEAASALRWCVAEMERRYRLMSALGVRNLAGFNAKVIQGVADGQPLLDPLWISTASTQPYPPELIELPYVVVVIDELADMMMVVGKKVEQLIARIAQKARAAGIHLILATQRPSVDVLTGLIKSNIPTRISFQVSSKIDSRTILDQQGADQLLGHGDMLFLAPGTGAPLRVHGAFVDDLEVHRIADDWRARGLPDYIEEITQQKSDGADGGSEESANTEEIDALYDQAVEFIIQTRKASVSAVQRRFKIGYNRAARLVEEMERTGLVGPLEGGFRDVLAMPITD